MRTVDLTPEDRLSREVKDDDSQKNSDWHERTGHPLLRLSEVPKNLRPNRTKAYIFFGEEGKKYLPAAYAHEADRRTVDQMWLHLGQTKCPQGQIPKPLEEDNKHK